MLLAMSVVAFLHAFRALSFPLLLLLALWLCGRLREENAVCQAVEGASCLGGIMESFP
ncbi:MAG: hypothetical protein KHW65_04090 [Clostridiales bacterium]|nr:hypothetical protein [Clostridiales bacterium]